MNPARKRQEPPACYAMVHAGLEEIAAEEIESDFQGQVKKSGQGIVVFRPARLDRSLLQLRTTEDVFLLGWGTDELSYRAEDLDKIRRWTERDVDWKQLLQIHHAIRPKPKGKPTWRLVGQMQGEHGYRRVDALKAMTKGVTSFIPASWKFAEENAALEIWITINGATAVCGVRLSDRTMRHRDYKLEHLKASLRPTVAASMVRLAEIKPGQTVIDPMCGAGTILAEALVAVRQQRSFAGREPTLLGGDIEPSHLRAAAANLRRLGSIRLESWDARKLPLEDKSVDRVLSNPPFGKQMSTPEEIGPLYRDMARELDRVLKPGGRIVLLVADVVPLRHAVKRLPWTQKRLVDVRILGQRATMVVYDKNQLSM